VLDHRFLGGGVVVPSVQGLDVHGSTTDRALGN
jgi:hypothetical protein